MTGLELGLLATIGKKVAESFVVDQSKKGLQGLLGRLSPGDRQKAVQRAITSFSEEFLKELEHTTPLVAAVDGYKAELVQLLESDGTDIAGHLQPDVKDVDLSPVQRMWDGLKLTPLPEEFDWTLVAKNYARALKKQVREDPALREELNTILLEQLAATQQLMAGLDPGFDLTGYRDYLRIKCATLQLSAMHSSTYDRRLLLWNIFVPQSARESAAVRSIPREVVSRLRRGGHLEREQQEAEIELLSKGYQSSPVTPVLDILDRERLVVILGDPGSGKTSLLKYLVLRWVEQPQVTTKLPIWIDLKEYAQRRVGLLNHLHSACVTFQLDAHQLEQRVKSGQATLYVDGLDEIFDIQARALVIGELTAFVARYSQAAVVVTSRIIGYEPERLRDAGFLHASLEDFDDKQLSNFLVKWHHAAEDDPQQRTRLLGQLRRALKQSRSVRDLAGNPLLLTMMAILNRHQELPRDRVELYRQASRVLLHQWDASRALPADQFERQEKEELLRLLAGDMQQRKDGLAGNLIHEEQLAEVFRAYLKEIGAADPYQAADRLVKQLTERNFILCYAGADHFSFVHRTFLEYFCAAYFVNRFERKRTLTLDELKAVFAEHWKDETWHEVLRLIAGMVGETQAEQLILFVMEQAAEESFADNYMLAAGCLNEVRNRRLIAKTDEDLRQRLLKQAELYASMGSGSQEFTLNAVYLLGTVWHSESTRLWATANLLKSEQLSLRLACLSLLVIKWPHHAETRTLFLDLSVKDPDETIRSISLLALKQIWRNDPAVQALPDPED